MQYFYRAHCTPEEVLLFSNRFLGARGFAAAPGSGDHARYTGTRGTVDLHVEIEGGHYTRVTLATSDVGESELDRVAKRLLSELHSVEEPRHKVRGGY
ncbi:MAG: hypothetical protein Q8Q85_11860 [Gemmatimonadales bacterium]|nr:hypothetical protein [Gemmatimonadales bacterium]